jgi:hypothetical protein
LGSFFRGGVENKGSIGFVLQKNTSSAGARRVRSSVTVTFFRGLLCQDL